MGDGVLNHKVRVTVIVKVGHHSASNRRGRRCGDRRRCGCWRWRCCGRQIVTDDVEVDPFGRRRGDIRVLIAASESVLHIRMELGARLAQPITKIAGRILIETHDVGVAAIDREIT